MSNMMLAVLNLLVLVTTVLTNEKTGVYFLYRNTIYLKHSNWVITIVNELDPYEQHTLEIKEQLDQFSSTFSSYSRNASSNDTQHIWPESIRFLTKAEQNFRGEYTEIHSLYQSVKSLVDMRSVNDRDKRAILPFVGSIMSYLFGMVTDEEIDDIKEKMSHLAVNQEKTIHLLDESFTAINITYEGVRTNRRVINKLSRAVSGLRRKINDIYDALRRGIQNARIILMVHDVYNIISDAMIDTRLSLQSLINLIENANRGQLTTDLISPLALSGLLNSIRRKLPNGKDLPYSLTAKGLKMYFENLQPILITGKGRFYITLVIPIISNHKAFEIYDVINEPVYIPESQLSVKIMLEPTSFAISSDRAEYIILHPDERIFCLTNPFCEMSSPIYNVLHAPTCLTALFQKDIDKVKRNCRTKIVETEKLPHAHKLFNNKWLFTTTSLLVADKICNTNHESINLQPGQTLLTIETNCELSTKFFHIPQQRVGNTQIKTEIQFAYDIETSWALPHVWNLTQTNLFGDKEEISSLEPIGNIPFGILKQQLDNVWQDSQSISSVAHSHTNTGLVLVIVCVIIVLSVLIVRYRTSIVKLLTNQSMIHTLKPTAPNETVDNVEMTTIAEDKSAVPPRNSWINASSTTRNPLTGDVIVITTQDNTAI